MKKELIEFLQWHKQGFNTYNAMSADKVVELYLNSIHSVQDKTPKVITNEKQRNICCDNCTYFKLRRSSKPCIYCSDYSRYKQM